MDKFGPRTNLDNEIVDPNKTETKLHEQSESDTLNDGVSRTDINRIVMPLSLEGKPVQSELSNSVE